MPPHLVQFLLGGQTCVVATVDEKARPMTTLMTWVVARNPQTLTMAVDTRGHGTAVIEKERMQSAPFPCALVAVRIEECRDHGAAGVKFVGPSYSYHSGKEHRSEVEKAVYAELKGSPPTI